MLIQMPILFALYRVFYNVPAYISSVKNVFTELVSGIMATDGYAKTMQDIYDTVGLRLQTNPDFTNSDTTVVSNFIIDTLYKLPENGWDLIRDNFSSLSGSIDSVIGKLEQINYLFVLNISDTPVNLIKAGWSDSKNFVLIICALLVPIVSYLTQLANIKLTPTATDNQNDQMAQQMKTMNVMMPLMSLFIAFTVPVGLGLYWIAGAIVRCIQMFFLNKHFEKIDLESIIEKNKDKAAAKAEKRGIRQAQIYEAAKMSTKNTMRDKANLATSDVEALTNAEALRSKANTGSMASKANLVKDFNEQNNK